MSLPLPRPGERQPEPGYFIAAWTAATAGRGLETQEWEQAQADVAWPSSIGVASRLRDTRHYRPRGRARATAGGLHDSVGRAPNWADTRIGSVPGGEEVPDTAA